MAKDERAAFVNSADGEALSTPLHLAARTGKLEACALLVEHGAIIGARDGRGMTAAQLAATNKRQHVVDFLLDAALNSI